MEIITTGSILRDKKNDRSRNYVNIVLSAKQGDGSRFYHIRNYQANARSNAHRMFVDGYPTYEDAMKAWNETQSKKLARNRVELEKIMDTFESVDEMEKALVGTEYRITMKNVRILKNKITNELSVAAEEAELSFDERIERRLEEAEDFSVIEKEAGIGKETREMAGTGWGMF